METVVLSKFNIESLRMNWKINKAALAGQYKRGMSLIAKHSTAEDDSLRSHSLENGKRGKAPEFNHQSSEA